MDIFAVSGVLSLLR